MGDKTLVELNKDFITENDIHRIENLCYQLLENEQLYELRNSAKLRAVYTSQNYDEFKDIVDAAHLRSLDKFDKRNAATKSRLWNSAAKEC